MHETVLLLINAEQLTFEIHASQALTPARLIEHYTIYVIPQDYLEYEYFTSAQNTIP